MIAIPPAIHAQFAQFLIGKALPPAVRGFYTKWLRFYWDFCHKYRHDPLHSDSLPLFLKKLQDKHQSEPQQKQAQQVISLFYEMQTAALHSPVNPKPVSVVSVVTHDPIKGTSSQALTDQSQHKLTVSGFNEVSPDSAASRVVASAAKADSSPANTGASWVFVFDRLLSEIKIRYCQPDCLWSVVGVSWDGLRQTSGFIRHTLARAKQAGNGLATFGG